MESWGSATLHPAAAGLLSGRTFGAQEGTAPPAPFGIPFCLLTSDFLPSEKFAYQRLLFEELRDGGADLFAAELVK